MIYLLHGENLYKRDSELAKLVGSSEVERYAGDEVDQSRLVDIFSGATLFSANRIVLVDELSANKSVWAELADWLDKITDDTTLILTEMRIDKRTKTYKSLQKYAKVIDCTPLPLRQSRQAEQWLSKYASEGNVELSQQQVSEMVARAVRPALDDQPMIDQALLASVIKQLSGVKKVTDDMIDAVMPVRTHDNVFGLLEAAIGGDANRLAEMIGRLQHNQDGHRVMALLSSQAVQLAAIVLARANGVTDRAQIASDIGANPYALGQLLPLASKMSMADASRLVERMAWADERMKRGANPWQMIAAVLGSLKTD